ncbi:MAG: bifunctional folylpolyglutamate synthase/dihydrofolate synthase [Clostridia bacterium]|nr:bifunctional folylpolyglutamate synthase/dihydrofolate synthase [Clostridia bacterium]
MTYNEAIEYIHSICWLGSRPGLERITELCNKMDNIQDKMKFIHIAGTNGKGSTSSMLTNILVNAGYRVGTFTSPFVYRFNERMAVNGKPISDDDLAHIIEVIKPLADSMDDPPTEFELITAAGFLYFYEQKCDIVVLECGMGGRLDSTNIIKKPLLSVITGIALDHTAFLGDTVEKIAKEKAGIIKEGCPVIYGSMPESCAKIIEDTSSLARPCDYSRLRDVSLSLNGAFFYVTGYRKPFKLKLVGGYQPRNAMLAISCAEMLSIDREAIHKGICETTWPARFEVLSSEPTVIYDGGHNPQGVDAAVSTVQELFEGKINILSGVMADKDYDYIASRIALIADKVYCVTPDNSRSLPADKYAEAFEKQGVTAYAFESMDKAMEKAYSDSKKENRPLLGLGSLYMYKEFVDALEKHK